MRQLKPGFSLGVSLAVTAAFSACSTTSPAGKGSKYAPYVSPSGQHVMPATPVWRIAPVYPASAFSRGAEGAVRTCFTITPKGNVENPRIVKKAGSGKGFDALGKEALRVIRLWKYSPEKINGRPVASKKCQIITFRIRH